MKSKLCIALGSCAFVTAISAPAFAADLPNMENVFEGKTPTYYYDLPAEEMLDLIIKDHKEGRAPGSKTKPSLLTKHLVRYENVPGLVNTSIANTFAAGNTFVCITSLTIDVSSGITPWNTPTTPSTITAYRNCGTSPNFTSWQRGSIGLTGLYNSYKLGIVADPTSTSKGQAFRDNPSQYANGIVPSDETWGVSFFDKKGTYGKIQEAVMVFTRYR